MDIATLGIAIRSDGVVVAADRLARMERAAQRAAGATKSLGAASATASALMRQFGSYFAAGFLLRASQQFLDASTRISNSLKVAGLSGGALTRVYDRLFESAQRNVAPIEALVQLYSRASLVQKELGISTEELLGFTDKVAVALRVSGKSAIESSGALLQLSQALGSGIVRAEEFNSILEGALPIAQAAAAGLKEAGGSVAKLRQLVVDGKISSEAFFRAFEAGSVILDEKVAGAELTVSQGFVRLQNVLIDAAGKFDDTTNASQWLANGLGAVSDAVEWLSDKFDRLASPVSTAIGWLDAIQAKALEIRTALGIEAFFNNTSLINGRLISQGFTDTLNGIDRSAIDARTAAIDKLRDSLVKMQSVAQDASRAANQNDRFAGAFGGTVTPVSINDYAAPTKDATTAAEKAQKAIDGVIESLAFEEAQLGRTAREQAIFNALNDAGVTITSKHGQQIATAAGRLYDLQLAQDAATKAMETAQELSKEFFGGFVRDILDGKSAVESLGDALGRLGDRLVDMALDQAINSLFGNLLGGLRVSGIGAGLFAKGAAFDHGNVTAFARGGIVDHPTLFPMARGMGLMGEAGPEAVMPLKRGPGGSLGVSAAGGGGRSVIEVRVAIDESGNIVPIVRQIAGGEAVRIVDNYDRQKLPRRVMKLKNDSIVVTGSN